MTSYLRQQLDDCIDRSAFVCGLPSCEFHCAVSFYRVQILSCEFYRGNSIVRVPSIVCEIYRVNSIVQVPSIVQILSWMRSMRKRALNRMAMLDDLMTLLLWPLLDGLS